MFLSNPSPVGRGWPAPAGRVRGTTCISSKFSLLYPSPAASRHPLPSGEGSAKNRTLNLKIVWNPYPASHIADREFAIRMAVPGHEGKWVFSEARRELRLQSIRGHGPG